MKTLLVFLKWKFLRLVVKRRDISFKKCLLRMYWMQELEKLPEYNLDNLSWLNYSKIRKLFIKEFPNKYLHNPYEK